MRSVLVSLLAAATLPALAGWAGQEAAAPQGEQAPPPSAPVSISDGELSLYPGSVFVVTDPPAFSWNASDPGGNDLLPRTQPLGPPRIPHGIADFVPIQIAGNACLDCHAVGAGVGAPELPASHRTDWRNAPEETLPTVTGARFNCVSCHVPTSDAPPLAVDHLPRP